MKHTFARFVTSLALLSVASAAHATPIIDQNQAGNNTYMAGFHQSDLAQSFQQAAANISGAGIFLQSGIGTSDNVTISLWDKLPNQGGAAMLASGSGVGTQGTWFDVFWTPVAITPGTTYYLVFAGNTTLGIAGDTTNPYPFGFVFANSGFGAFPTYDYTFRTFADDARSPVPEPATLGLLGVGLAALAFRVKRRTQK